MLKENSRIERVKVDVLGLHIKVMKQISKISPSREIRMHFVSDDIKIQERDCLVLIMLSC